MGRLPEVPAGSEVVASGSSQDPFTQPASPPAPAGPSSGAPADQGGEGKSAAIDPAELPPTRPVLEPPPPAGAPAQAPAPAPAQLPAQATAAPAAEPTAALAAQPPAPAAAPVQPPAPAVPPGATAPPVAPAPEAPAAPVQPTADEIRAEGKREGDQRVAAVQAGKDRRIDVVEAQQETLTKQLEESRQQTRDLIINGLPESERPAKLSEYELEDAKREVEVLRTDAVSYGTDVEMASLLLEFRDVPGVTEEALRPVPVDERDVWCMTKQNEHLREQLDTANNGVAAAPTAAPAQVPVTVPAGAQAPSDAGGGAGTPPPPGQPVRNEGKGPEAMTENMRGGWEAVDFSKPR